jgi:hypothetical protein
MNLLIVATANLMLSLLNIPFLKTALTVAMLKKPGIAVLSKQENLYT